MTDMSSNKGKDGEMRVIKIVADIATQEEGFDFTRQTITNESDMGADLMLRSSRRSLERLIAVSSGSEEPSNEGDSNQSQTKSIETRIDVKTTESKLQTDTVDKFASDIRKHPKCSGHILMGGEGLTGPAQRKFDQYKETFAQGGKILAYISNSGIRKLENKFSKSIAAELKNNDED